MIKCSVEGTVVEDFEVSLQYHCHVVVNEHTVCIY